MRYKTSSIGNNYFMGPVDIFLKHFFKKKLVLYSKTTLGTDLEFVVFNSENYVL